MSQSPHPPDSSMRPAGSASRGASVFRSASSPPRFISLNSGGALRNPQPLRGAWSLVLPGLWLRAYAAGYVKKNRELTQTGPYAHTRNPLYLGSMLIAAGFALALLSWPVALVLAIGFAVIYIPVIASEERFLRATFPDFDDYCRRVPRLIPRLFPAPTNQSESPGGAFSMSLYRKHREYNAAIGAALLYLSLLLLQPRRCSSARASLPIEPAAIAALPNSCIAVVRTN